jgi:hypothetical protein
MRRIRDHLTYANVMVTLLAFIVLTGGTAVALNGTNTVQSDDLGPGAQVKAPDVAANAINSAGVVNETLTGADIRNKSGVDTCVITVRLGDVCFRAENRARPWNEASSHCANLNLRLPSFGEARALARNYDLPNIEPGEFFWTDETFGAANDLRAFVEKDPPDSAAFFSALISTSRETVCVTTPTN